MQLFLTQNKFKPELRKSYPIASENQLSESANDYSKIQSEMKLIELNKRPQTENAASPNRIHEQYNALVEELKDKDIPPGVIVSINGQTEALNAASFDVGEFEKAAKSAQAKILKLLQRELSIVPKNHFRNLWMVIGMSAFGLPIGMAFGLSLDNKGLMAIGIPIGMAIGIAIGTAMDNKAAIEGRQLNVEITK